MLAEDELTTPQAAAYIGMTRQALTIAAERGEIGRKESVIGRRPPYIWIFKKSELDTWKAAQRTRLGRPKIEAATPSPVVVAI